jgi:hypothetical protein
MCCPWGSRQNVVVAIDVFLLEKEEEKSKPIEILLKWIKCGHRQEARTPIYMSMILNHSQKNLIAEVLCTILLNNA